MLRSLKTRLGLGAGLIALVAVLASVMAIHGSRVISDRITDALEAQRRIEAYSTLAAQISGFAVLAVEAQQSDRGTGQGAGRLDNSIAQIADTFDGLTADIEQSVMRAETLGLDEQSRRATRGIVLARMRALFDDVTRSTAEAQDSGLMRARLDSFSTRFAPLLNDAINEENRIRSAAVNSISTFRAQLTRAAIAVALIAMALFAIFYTGIVRPLFQRLDLFSGAAQRIANADFGVELPVGRGDEVDRVLAETNRLAGNLATREGQIQADRARLNDIIAEQTDDLRTANARLARVDEDRQRFFADFSHELRTPLTVILMEAELGLKSGLADDAFRVIRTRAARLNRRIDDLLRLARSESGQIALDPTPFDLRRAAREAVEDCERQAERADMQITLDAPSNIPVQADLNWTRQVIDGLIENAIRHARDGGQIRVIVDSDGRSGRVRVVDNGNGIGDDDRARIFDRFAQADGDTRRQGFGIGLALAKWVTDTQGGTIAVTSPVPDDLRIGTSPGAMMTITLPPPGRGDLSD